jgi:hypothetical protein
MCWRNYYNHVSHICSLLPARFRIYDLWRHVFGAWHWHFLKYSLMVGFEHAYLFIASQLMELCFTPGCLFSSLRLWVCRQAASSFVARHVETAFEKVWWLKGEREGFIWERLLDKRSLITWVSAWKNAWKRTKTNVETGCKNVNAFLREKINTFDGLSVL